MYTSMALHHFVAPCVHQSATVCSRNESLVVVQPWAAIIIGGISGIVYVGSSRLVSHVMKIDDPLDCIAVHLFCGMLGILLAPAFVRSEYYRLIYTVTDNTTDERISGYLFGGDGRMLGCAFVVLLAILAWVLGHMCAFASASCRRVLRPWQSPC